MAPRLIFLDKGGRIKHYANGHSILQQVPKASQTFKELAGWEVFNLQP